MKQIRVNSEKEYTDAVKYQVAKFATNAVAEKTILSAILIIDNGKEYVTEMVGAPRHLGRATKEMKNNIFGPSVGLVGLILVFLFGVSFGIWVAP